MKHFVALAVAFCASLSAAFAGSIEIPATSWATFISGDREGVLAPGIVANPAGGFYLYSSGDRPIIKFNADGTIAWEVRQEPGVNDVREVAQLDILDNGDLIAIVAANSNARVFGQPFVASGRFLVRLRSADASAVFVKDLGNCWLTAVKARPGGGYFVGGFTLGDARIGADQLPITTNQVFVAQFSTGLDWVTSGDWNGFQDSIGAIRTSGSGAGFRVWAVGDASHPSSFGGKTLAQAGVYLAMFDSNGTVLNAQVEAPNATLAAFEMRPGGGAHLAAKSLSGVNDLWRLNGNGGVVWHVSMPAQIAGITATDDPYVTGNSDNVAFTASFDSVGGQKWSKSEATRSAYTGNGAAVLNDGRLAICGVTAPSGIVIDDFFLRDFQQIENTYYCAYVATLEITPTARPVFRAKPRDQKLALRGENVTLHADVFSPGAVTLRWYKNGSVIPGQTSADVTLPNAQAADSGAYFLEAQNSAGVTRSTTIIVTINSVTVSTVSGTDAAGNFDSPRSPIVLPDGSILVVDPTKNVIKRVTPTAVTTFAGSGAPGLANGAPLEAMFSSPGGLALEFRYNGPIVYVADRGNNLIRRVRLSSDTSDPLSVDSLESAFAAPETVATLDGLPFVVSATDASIGVWKYDQGTISPLQGSLSAGAIGGLAFDEQANLYLSDTLMNEIRRTTPADQVDTIATSLNAPTGIALDESGNLYVTERGGHAVHKISPTGTKTIVAGLGISGFQNGSNSQALFNAPDGICFRNHSLIVADSGNHCLREITFTPLNGNNSGDAQLRVVFGNTLTLSVSASASASFAIESTAQIGPGAQWQFEGNVTAGAEGLALAKPATTRFYRARQLP